MSYNAEIQSNNNDLQTILNKVNALPEAGGGEIPTCTVKLTFALWCHLISYVVAENGAITSKMFTDTEPGQITFENVVCGSPITVCPADVMFSSGGLEVIGTSNGNWTLQAPTTPGAIHEGTIEKGDF